jgi:hypothetical protein
MFNSDINPIIDHLNKLPKILYKYRSSDSIKHTISLATKGDSYFASASEFNDPFELYFIPKSILLKLKGEKLREYLRKKALEHYPDIDEDGIESLLQRGLNQRDRLQKGDPKGMEAVIKLQHSKFGIFSLTPISTSIPMWSYYANSHKGFCIGLYTNIIGKHQQQLVPSDKVLILKKVNYQKRMIKYNIDNNSQSFTRRQLKELELLLFTKSSVWKHEKEFRLLYHDHPSTIYSFGKEAVAELIIGDNTSEKDKNQLIEKISSDNPSVRLRQAIKSNNSYNIKIIDLE